MSINSFTGMGRLTRDPESRQAGSTTVTGFSLAIDRNFKKGEDWVKETLFLDCACWAKKGDALAAQCRKGDMVYVTGYLKLDEWEDKTSGEKRSKMKCQVQDWHQATMPDKRAAAAPVGNADDCPF